LSQFLKIFNKKEGNENPSGGSRIVLYGRTDAQTDITKIFVAVRNVVSVPK